MDKSTQIDTFCRFARVSRETITSLKKYEDILLTSNKSLNLIGKSTINEIWQRHFLDSSQVIEFIDKNDTSLIDLGTGAGFPGLVIAILSRDRKIPINIRIVEKSIKKTQFLKKITKELDLKVEIINQNVFDKQFKLVDDIIVARAFKPLKVILELIHSKGKNWKKIIIFLGKTGNQDLLQASKNWDIKYKQSMSVTSSDSKLIEIYNLRKKN